jgi:hypothetical protein
MARRCYLKKGERKKMLNGYKTYLAALAALLIAVGSGLQSYCNGQPINFELIVSAFIALSVLFLRRGVKEDLKTSEVCEEEGPVKPGT